jgi:polyhydroxybutyrate depolymerase
VRRRDLVLGALLALGVLPSCSTADAWERAACDPAKPAEPGTHPVELDGRHALVHVPEGYDGTEAQPVVLTWHAYGGTAQQQLDYTGMVPVADEESFILVAPEGTGSPPRFDQELGIHSKADDVGFALALLDHVAAGLCADPARVYSVGLSNGAGITAVLGCRAAERFAAVAMSALVLLPEACKQPVPAVLGYMGTADLTIPFEGGHVSCCGGWDVAPADTTMAGWAANAGCDDEADVDDEGDGIERRVWHDCNGDREVRYYVVDGGGHTWPGADQPVPLSDTTQALDAANETWEFFRRYSLDDANR